MRQLPVAEMSGTRRSASKLSPTSEAEPTTRLNTPGQPCASITRLQICCTAAAHSGTLWDGFQISGSPHTAATAAFQAHTATGKLKAVMTPTGPSGCHCSYMRWLARSLCMERP